MIRRFCVAVLLATVIATAGGCLVTGGTDSTRTGNYVSQDLFTSIEPGKTTMAWVQATLGDPTSRTTADGNVVWKYTYTERTDSGGAVFLIFGSHSTTETVHNAFIEFKDGVVTRKWRG
ncbi:hypothetical protein BH10PLA1_BH10PLA1_04520 [soil metagenome]